MTTHQDLAATLLVGTTLSSFTFCQGFFTLRFSRWSHQTSLGQPLPFDLVLEVAGDMHIDGPLSWGDLCLAQAGAAEALLAARLVRICQGGDDAEAAAVCIVGADLELLFTGGARIVVRSQADGMLPDWCLNELVAAPPSHTAWSVFSEGGVVDSKRPSSR